MAKKQCGAFRTTIGGQALIEGILMRGPEKQAIVVRGPEGLVIKEEELKLIRDKYPVLSVQQSNILFTSRNTKARKLYFVKHPLVQHLRHKYWIG